MQKRFFLLLLTILLNFSLYAQQVVDYSKPMKYKVGGISISGVKYLDQDALIKLTGLNIGQTVTVPGDDITKVVEKFWKQNLFADVRASITKISGEEIFLDFYLQERPRLSKVYFKGIRKTEETDLNEAIKLIPGSQVTQNTINNTREIIRKHYSEKGFFNVDIRIVVKEDTLLQNVVNMYINIDKQKKVKIEEIIVDGNQYFSDAKVRRFLKETKKRRWYGLFKPSKYINDKFEEDKVKLITKYNENGFRDAKILTDSIYSVGNNRLMLYLKLEEGKQYYFRNIAWVGNTKYNSLDLAKVLDIKKGDLYDQGRLDKRLLYDQDAVGNLYMDDGYLFFQSIPREVSIANDSIDIEIFVYEGRQATNDRIIITGNTRTNDHVIRREIRSYPGDLFSKTAIIRSVRELAQLGNFDPEKLSPNPVPNQEKGTVDIEYAVTEKSNDMFELSGGWGGGMFVGRLGVRFNNFSTRNFFEKSAWQPLPIGDGQHLNVSYQSNGTRYQLYSISFEEPWLGGKKPTSLSVSFYHNLMTNGYKKGDSRRAEMKVWGSSVGIGKRLKWPDDNFTLYQEISLQKYILKKYQIIERIDSGNFNIISYKVSFGRNSIDNPIFSRSGSAFSLSLELTPPYTLISNKKFKTDKDIENLKWMEYHKWTLNAQWFNKLIGDFVLHTRIQYGFLGYYNKDLGYSPFQGFSLGGDGMGYYQYGKDIIGLRGYTNESLTPSSGGNLYSKYTMEIRYPIVNSESANIYAMTFLEAGNCWNKANQFNPFSIKRSAGIGVRLFLPMLGMIGLDWGYGFDDIPGNEGANKSQFHFVLGQQF